MKIMRLLVSVWAMISLLLGSCNGVQDTTGTGGVASPIDDVEYAAIKTIHKQLDDNADGSVDLSESAEFVQTELCGSPVAGEEKSEMKTTCIGSEKSLKFHRTDTQITSTELWVTWHQNEVFNWTNQDVLNWLEHYVELPKYSSAFIENQITGRHLPYIAINSGQILQNTLSITDGQHKQKLQLRAMDVILFGPPVQRGRWKETILEISAFLMVCGMIYVLWQRKLSKAHMDSFMEDLRLKEEEINRLRSKFEEIERESTDAPGISPDDCQKDPSPPIMMSPAPNSSDGSEDDSASICKSCSSQALDSLSQAQKNMEFLQQRVWFLEEELDTRNRSYQVLQNLLPECQQREREQLEFRKSVGEEQMARAQRACEKIRKRRSTLFGSFHLANSSVLDEAGLQITKAVNKMQSISEYYEEHHKRWNRIGHLCGFHITSPYAKSPDSHSPTEPISHFRYPNSVFQQNHRRSDMVHSTSFHTEPNPLATISADMRPRFQSFSLPRRISASPHVNQDQKRHSEPVVPTPTHPTCDAKLTDSVDSVSSSGSSAASQPSGLVMAKIRSSSVTGRGDTEGEGLPLRAHTDGGYDRGKMGMGRLENFEKKLVRRKVLATGTLEEETDAEVRSVSSPSGASNSSSPRGNSSSPRGARGRVRMHAILSSTNV